MAESLLSSSIGAKTPSSFLVIDGRVILSHIIQKTSARTSMKSVETLSTTSLGTFSGIVDEGDVGTLSR